MLPLRFPMYRNSFVEATYFLFRAVRYYFIKENVVTKSDNGNNHTSVPSEPQISLRATALQLYF